MALGSSAAPGPGAAKYPHAGGPLPKGTVKPAPWWANMGQKWSETTQSVTAGVQKNWAATSKKWMKNGKFQMPVDVQVDVFRPAADWVQESSTAIWTRLPPPAQQAAPYVGAAALSALIVHRMGSRKLRAERERNQRLRGRVDLLLSENEELHNRLSDLKLKQSGPKSASEIQLAHALAEATQAAAAAATAAATAATACMLRPGKQMSESWKTD